MKKTRLYKAVSSGETLGNVLIVAGAIVALGVPLAMVTEEAGFQYPAWAFIGVPIAAWGWLKTIQAGSNRINEGRGSKS